MFYAFPLVYGVRISLIDEYHFAAVLRSDLETLTFNGNVYYFPSNPHIVNSAQFQCFSCASRGCASPPHDRGAESERD